VIVYTTQKEGELNDDRKIPIWWRRWPWRRWRRRLRRWRLV